MSILNTKIDKHGKIIANPDLILRKFQLLDLQMLHDNFTLSPYLFHVSGKGYPKYKELFHYSHIKLDIKDCFESISYSRIVGIFKMYRGNPVESAKCHSYNGTLMRGGIASVKIMDCVMVAMDYRLHGLARKYGGYYARYMDDFIFYWTKPILNWIASSSLIYITSIVMDEGFSLNHDKTSFENFIKSTNNSNKVKNYG